MNAPDPILTAAEQAKRNNLKSRKPYVAEKLAKISAMEARGEISPIIRLEKSYLCNFHCSHCSAEYYMDRHFEKVFKVADTRSKMSLDDVRELSRQADELGLARFVITGGEPLVMKDFDAVVAAIDPDKHYIVTDTNGWFLDNERARHLKEIGVEKVQLSLDSFIEQDHDNFRNKPGSYKRVMRAIDATLDAGLNLILATVLVRGRAKTQEFRDLCKFVTDRCIGLYVSYAKPSGACSDHPELVIDKEDADAVRELEKEFNVFTHMTPSYGSFKGCITVKGIITVTSTMEITPCPYIDMSIGNLRETPLKEILARGMRNPWLGSYRPDCLIGEDQQFIKLHSEKTQGVSFLPVRWGDGFTDHDQVSNKPALLGIELFDETGRCIPHKLIAPAPSSSRRQFVIHPRPLDTLAIYARITSAFTGATLVSAEEFSSRVEAILDRLRKTPSMSNIIKGPVVPFMLPQAQHEDIGTALETIYLPRVEKSFRASFPNRTFSNHLKTNLNHRITLTEGSRHDTLINAMHNAPIVGCYFPCLTEYSIKAAVEQVGRMDVQFLLAGGYDTCAALIACPDLLQRNDGYSPLLWQAALSDAERVDASFLFEAYGENLTFNRRIHFDQSAEYWASALIVLG